MITFNGQIIENARPILGSSFYIPRFLQDHLGLNVQQVYDQLMHQAPWQARADPNMLYRGGKLKRTKAFFARDDNAVDVNAPLNSIPSYGYTGRQLATLLYYRPFQLTPVVRQMADSLQTISIGGQPVAINHAIATRYDDGVDNIGYHHDKTQDFTPNTPIVSVSVGESREMHFDRPSGNDPNVYTFAFAQVLNPGDFVILSAADNIAFRHSIVPIHDERIIDRKGPAYYFLWMHKRRLGHFANIPISRACARLVAKHILAVQPRVSIVFRDIATHVPLAEAKKKAAKSLKEREKRQQRKRDLAATNSKPGNTKKHHAANDDDDDEEFTA